MTVVTLVVALLYLAAAGIGHIGVIDDDMVDESNLQRQVIHGTNDIGVPKVDSAMQAIAALNPDVIVEPIQQRLSKEIVLDLVGQYDVVLDGADNFATRGPSAGSCAAGSTFSSA